MNVAGGREGVGQLNIRRHATVEEEEGGEDGGASTNDCSAPAAASQWDESAAGGGDAFSFCSLSLSAVVTRLHQRRR